MAGWWLCGTGLWGRVSRANSGGQGEFPRVVKRVGFCWVGKTRTLFPGIHVIGIYWVWEVHPKRKFMPYFFVGWEKHNIQKERIIILVKHQFSGSNCESFRESKYEGTKGISLKTQCFLWFFKMLHGGSFWGCFAMVEAKSRVLEFLASIVFIHPKGVTFHWFNFSPTTRWIHLDLGWMDTPMKGDIYIYMNMIAYATFHATVTWICLCWLIFSWSVQFYRIQYPIW